MSKKCWDYLTVSRSVDIDTVFKLLITFTLFWENKCVFLRFSHKMNNRQKKNSSTISLISDTDLNNSKQLLKFCIEDLNNNNNKDWEYVWCTSPLKIYIKKFSLKYALKRFLFYHLNWLLTTAYYIKKKKKV